MELSDLLVDLRDIPSEGLELNLNIAPEAVAGLVIVERGEEPVVVSPLTGRLRVLSDGSRLTIRGSFRVTVEIPCDRCLAEAPADIDSQVDEVLELGSAKAIDPEDEEVDGRLPVIDGRVDLSGLLGELFWLAWPFRFICRSDCAGLCARCGAELNDGPCCCDGSVH